MSIPSHAAAVAALRTTDTRFPWVGPSDEEADVAAAVEQIDATHRGTADDPDRDGKWGRCTACRAPWPCPTWWYGGDVAVQYLGRAADRVFGFHETRRSR